MKTRDRIAGSLYGMTIGDTLGSSLEFGQPTPKDQPQHTEIEGGGGFGWRRGQGTDDSDMAFALARTYASGYDINKLGQEFVSWRRSCRDIGGATSRAIAKLEAGVPPLASGGRNEQDAGNGSLMRIAPVGLTQRHPAKRRQQAIEAGDITHADSRATGSCIFYSELLSHLVDGNGVDRALEAAFAVPIDDERVKAAAAEGLEPGKAIEDLGTSGYVLHGLALGTWALRRAEEVGAEQALVEIVNRGDDSDTNGAIAGALLGALYGKDAWPERWRSVVEYGPAIDALAPVLDKRRRYAFLRPRAKERERFAAWGDEQWSLLSGRPARTREAGPLVFAGAVGSDALVVVDETSGLFAKPLRDKRPIPCPGTNVDGSRCGNMVAAHGERCQQHDQKKRSARKKPAARR
jgi:ADP-ribosylglycohydrolase